MMWFDTRFASVANHCDADPACSLSVRGNEGAAGDRNTSPDWEILKAHDVELRAGRMRKSDARLYTIIIDCEDTLNLSASTTVEVSVPHNHRK